MLYLQKSQSGMARNHQSLHYRAHVEAEHWWLRCLLVGLLCCCMQPTLFAAAQSASLTQNQSLTTQLIRYHLAEAGEVFLVWGVNGWAVVPEAQRPAGTVIKDGVMHTPMERVGDIFAMKVRVPSGATIHYGFLITKTRSGAAIKVWEGSDKFIMIARQVGVVEMKSTLTLAQDQRSANTADAPLVTQEIRYQMPEAGEVFLVWGVNGWAVVPEAQRPAGTVIKDGVMHTPMERVGDIFVTKVRVPSGATIHYDFLITKTSSGAAIELWDAKGDPKQEYQTITAQDGVAEVKSKLTLPQAKPPVSGLNRWLQLLIGISIISGVAVILVMSFLRAPLRRRRLTYLRDLLRELVARDMKLRYERSVLGIAWSVLTPLVQLIVFNFIFTSVLPLNVPNYPSFLFIGLVAWNWFQVSLFEAANAITGNRELIKRPGFPTTILPAIPLMTHLIHFLLALPILLIFLALVGDVNFRIMAFPILALPVVIAIQFALILSLAFLIAPLQVRFRDTQHILGIFLLLLFYLSPVFYDTRFIPARYWPLYRLNPLVHLIDAYRAVLLRGELPDSLSLLYLGAFVGGLLCLSYTIFVRVNYRFAEEL